MFDTLTSLFSGKPKPFSSHRIADAWCKRMAEEDPATSCNMVHAQLTEMLAETVPPSLDRLQAIMHVDDFIQEAYSAICYQYVSNPRMPKELEQKLWREISEFARDMLEAYRRYVHMVDGEALRVQLRPHMPLLLARSLRYLAIQAKWHYFRFEKAPGRLWHQAHQLYRLAEIDGVDSDPLMAYSREKEVTSCADEYIQLLMLGMISSNNLTIIQLQYIDEWLDKWSKLVQLSRKYQEGQHHFCVSLQDSQGPCRVGSETVGDFYRYWGVAELVAGVQDVLSRIEAGAKPRDLGLGEECHAAGCQDLLRHLLTFWTMSMRNSQISRSERYKVAKAASVIHGLDLILKHVKEDNDRYGQDPAATPRTTDYDEALDMRLYGFVSSRTRQKQAQNPYAVQSKAQDWQTWSIENESVGGFGAVLHFSENEWVRPGALIGIRLGVDQNWQLGVLRRLNRLNGDEVYAGLQILTATPVMVSMHSDEMDRIEKISVSEVDPTGGYTVRTSRVGLYVPYRTDSGENQNTLIIHSADYGHERIYQVHARDKMFTVCLGAVIDKGVDWTWVSVSVLQQNA